MVSAATWMLSLKLLFISTGILGIALGLKVSVFLVLEFCVSQAPLWWATFRSWLKPPYLYVIINGIIITIAASAWFQQNNSDKDQTEHMQQPRPKISVDQRLVLESDAKNGWESDVVESIDSVYDQIQRGKEVEAGLFMEEINVAVEDSSEVSLKKPAPSSRFGHRKPVKANPEGWHEPKRHEMLRVAKPKRHETLENTWKMITERKAMPLSRHLKKSDTWENHNRHIDVHVLIDSPLMKKSETFRDRTNYQQPPAEVPTSGKLRKEPSLSQDELNRRVEAFINKFNDDMRLQKQESINQYLEMINRGT